MITIKDFMETISYRITDGAEFSWDCYGPNAYILDFWNGEHDNSASVGIVFDRVTHIVYQMEAWDGIRNREYRWIHPAYKDAIVEETKNSGEEFEISYDDNKFIDLDLPEDMLEKATAIANGEEYNPDIMIALDLDDDSLFLLMKMAHEDDLSLNKFVEKILREEISKLQVQEVWPPVNV